MSSCIFPGSFDPITCGHLDLIRRSASIFDSVTVTVMVNPGKAGCIPYKERVRLIQRACIDLPNVKAEMWHGLLADYVRNHPGSVVVRGVRSTGEYERERNSAAINRKLFSGCETLLLPASDQWADISSSVVKEIAFFGGDFSDFVPETVYPDIKKWIEIKDK